MKKSCCPENLSKDSTPAKETSSSFVITGISPAVKKSSAVMNPEKKFENFSLSSFITGFIQSEAGKIPVVRARMLAKDHLGAFKVRWGIGRMKYEVSPGLYAVGSPDRKSPVLVTANYKLTFDLVRRELGGISAWILVLDTKGINVWCAAGKGTFGTKELVARIRSTNLEKIVDHKTVIIPQLGAVGVSAHLTAKETSFRVIFGPVRAKDIPVFLEQGMKKTKEMSMVKFTFRDRLALVPLEVVGAWRAAIAIFVGAFLFGLLSEYGFLPGHGPSLGLGMPSLYTTLIYPLYLLGGLFSGTVLSPLLLPFVPVKPFSLKGALISLALSAIITMTLGAPLAKAIPLAIIASAISAYAALQFTGASTYTSENGVRREVKYSVPAIYSAVCLGIVWVVVNVALTMVHF